MKVAIVSATSEELQKDMTAKAHLPGCWDIDRDQGRWIGMHEIKICGGKGRDGGSCHHMTYGEALKELRSRRRAEIEDNLTHAQMLKNKARELLKVYAKDQYGVDPPAALNEQLKRILRTK